MYFYIMFEILQLDISCKKKKTSTLVILAAGATVIYSNVLYNIYCIISKSGALINDTNVSTAPDSIMIFASATGTIYVRERLKFTRTC